MMILNIENNWNSKSFSAQMFGEKKIEQYWTLVRWRNSSYPWNSNLVNVGEQISSNRFTVNNQHVAHSAPQIAEMLIWSVIFDSDSTYCNRSIDVHHVWVRAEDVAVIHKISEEETARSYILNTFFKWNNEMFLLIPQTSINDKKTIIL